MKITTSKIQERLDSGEVIFSEKIKVSDVTYKTFNGMTTVTAKTDDCEWGKIRFSSNAQAAAEAQLGDISMVGGRTIVAKLKAFAPTTEEGRATVVILDIESIERTAQDNIQKAVINKMARAMFVNVPSGSAPKQEESSEEKVATGAKAAAKVKDIARE